MSKRRLGERLIEAGLVTAESVEKALEHQKITGYKLGDCLVELGLLQEAALLRFLAAEFNTRFVSAEKLAKAKLPTDVLDKLPVRTGRGADGAAAGVRSGAQAAVHRRGRAAEQVAAGRDRPGDGRVRGLRLRGPAQRHRGGHQKHYYGDPTAFTSLEAGNNSPQIAGRTRPRWPTRTMPRAGAAECAEPAAPHGDGRRLRPRAPGTQSLRPNTQMRDAGGLARRVADERLHRDAEHPRGAAGAGAAAPPRPLGAAGAAGDDRRAAHGHGAARSCPRWPSPRSCTTWASPPSGTTPWRATRRTPDWKTEAKRLPRRR